MANTLKVGQSRIGFLYDGIPDTPHVAIQLSRDEDGIEFTLPWIDVFNAAHERWFLGPDDRGADPADAYSRDALPTEVEFADSDGVVSLVGCRTKHWNTSVYGGRGRASIDFAVLDGLSAGGYTTINGLRSEVEGLGSWVGLRSLSVEPAIDADGFVKTATFTLRAPAPVPVARVLNLAFRPSYHWRPGDRVDETVIRESMLVQTQVSKPRDWWDHLDLHFAVRDLLRVLAWRDLNFTDHRVTRDDDPFRTLDGADHGRAWREVVTSATGLAQSPQAVGVLDYPCTFDDVGSAGVRRWLRFYSSSPRAVMPFVRLLELRGASLETALAQIGMGYDGLGQLLLLEAGTAPRRAKEVSIEGRIERVVASLPYTLPFDVGQLPQVVASAYNSVKHANRTSLAPVRLKLAYWAGVQIFRAWVLSRIGAPPEMVDRRLAYDSISRRVIALADAAS